MCPYCQETKTEFQKWKQDPDDNQTLVEGQTATRTVYTYVKCKQEKCGVFYNGRCHYNDK